MIVENGLAAMVYFQQVGRHVKIGKDDYFFNVQANICMAWVKPEHVQSILNITETCCGGNIRRPYKLANEMQVRRFMRRSER